jgi:hypothetical protein
MTEDDVDARALEIARKAVEDVLIEFRDNRLSVLGRGNGFVIHEADGQESSVIRLKTVDGLRIGIKAYLAALNEGPS